MNDYTRRIDIRGHRIAPLNGDTAVYSSLEARWAYHHHKPWNGKFHHFNITEDFCIDDHDHEAPQKTPDDYFPLLYSPLPADLPLIDKDKLFYVAAYTGDIDRYVRLKRPQTLPHERSIVIHGIYHNVFFAKWWSTQVAEPPKSGAEISIRRAINARRIMSNDLSWMAADTPENLLPENIWYPSFARPSTYESLAHLQPKMFTRCLRACIAAGYDHTWDQLLLEPPEGVQSFKSSGHPSDRDSLKLWRISRIVDANIWEEANSVPQKKFLQEICAAVPDILNDPPYGTDGDWASSYTASDLHRSSSPDIFIHDPVQPTSGIGPYDGLEGDIGDIGLAVFVRDNLEIEAWEREQEKRGSSESFLLLQEIRDVLATIRSS
ncbi:hypothetical protein N7468_007746 [Penicillium chermesinum]|uniref:Uncharacterized protein n=1 Tax=Penicillium chermesinum TaxID=63820 RepID=A0A9W9TKU9_9EURO|nr:uncharacterized protein N7468_007746 [Penicillium chermesinum]KAJ5226521.1 hypothetical protein N7468_007746 [Penicillium chermesinum]